MRCAAVAVIAISLASCGRKDEPLPPLIREADPTRDLAVFQEGTQAVLAWSYPALTTDGAPLPDVEAIEVWRATIPTGQEPTDLSRRDREIRYQLLAAQGDRIALLAGGDIDRATRGPMLEVRDDLVAWRSVHGSEEPWVVWYAVRTQCCRGRLSRFSNIARLEPQLPPLPPDRLALSASADGVVVRWRAAPGSLTIVERSEPGGEWRTVTAEPVAGSEWRDEGAAQNTSWRYRLRSVLAAAGGSRVVGDPGGAAAIDYRDVYPPAAPDELVCLPEHQLVRLRWPASADAASYLVERRVGRGPWRVLADHHQGLVFEDPSPPIGDLTYAVRALDGSANRSEAASCRTVIGVAP